MGVQACALPVSGRGRIRAAARAIAVIRVMGLLLGAGLPVEAQAGIGGGAGAGLVQGAFGRGARGDAGAGDVSLVGQVAGVEKDRTVQAVEGEIPAGAEAEQGVRLGLPRVGVVDKIGRASCRERWCPYCEISGVAGSLKKKKT